MYDSSRGLNHEEQRGEENITLILITDPWSKENYSRHSREASMVKGKLPEVDPPSGRVPGRSLLVLPILEARRRRNRGEIAKKGSLFGSFTSREINRRRGAARGATRGPGAPLARPHPRARREGAWGPGRSPLAPLGDSRSFYNADFLLDFSRIFGALLIWGKPEIEKQQKTRTGSGVH